MESYRTKWNKLRRIFVNFLSLTSHLMKTIVHNKVIILGPIGTNWVLNMSIRIFMIAGNVGAKCKVITKSCKCKCPKNYEDT